MIKNYAKTIVVLFVFFSFCLSSFSQGITQGKGNLVGFIYLQDGVTPIVGAIVKVKDASIKDTLPNQIFESSKSDANGMFTIENLNMGLYTLGVVMSQGSYNLEELIGIKAGETTKVSFSLGDYSDQEAAAVQKINNILDQEAVAVQGINPEIYREAKENNEVLVGRVLSYNHIAGEEYGTADIFVEQGYIKNGDQIHVRDNLNVRIDHYQDVNELVSDGRKVDKIFAGSNVRMPMKYAVDEGDLVYLVCKKGISGFFLTPLGYISALAATGVITYGIVTITQEPCPECSAFAPTTGTSKR